MINLDLTGKIAVITGASGELGRVISRTLAEAGASVALHYYHNKDKAQAGADDILQAGDKAGQDRLLRVLAKEIGEFNITINQVAPGWMISDKFREDPIDDSSYIKNVPLGRRGEDQKIANAVCFLASNLAGFISGVYLPVCSGNVMPGI